MTAGPGRPKGSKQKNSWPDDHIYQLKGMWTDGLSAAQCAQSFAEAGVHYTRSAIIGKVHRMGISDSAPRKPSNSRPEGLPKAMRSRPRLKLYASQQAQAITAKHADNIAKAAAQVAMEEAAILPMPANAITSREREDHQCAWPVGENDKKEMMVCGGKVSTLKRGGVYCAHHMRVGTTGEQRKPIRAWS